MNTNSQKLLALMEDLIGIAEDFEDHRHSKIGEQLRSIASNLENIALVSVGK